MLGEAAGKARCQQAGGLDRDIAQIEQLARRSVRPPSARAARHRLRRSREHHHVAEQEDPEAVAGNDPLRRRAVVHGRRARRRLGCMSVDAMRSLRPSRRSPHSVMRPRRAATLARSIRATSSAGITYSSWSRQANTTKVGERADVPAATIHQMCQISAKPMMVAKNAQTKPVGELRGISMS